MTYGTIEYRGDKKRLEQSLLISSLFWLLFFGILAIVPIRSTPPAEPTMNPVYIELAAAREQEPEPVLEPVREPSEAASQTSASQTATLQAATAAGPRSAVTPQAAAPKAAPQAAAPTAAAAASSVSGPAPQRSPAAPSRSSPYQSRGGEDPFAPLSEADLAAATSDNQPLPAAPSQSPSASSRSSAAENQKSTAGSTDSLSGRIQNVSDTLASRSPAAAGSGGSQESAAASTSGSKGPVGAFDFGDGPRRRLLSAPQPTIPARLLEGQPSLIETTVRFRIDKGGAVIALSIQFDPPLPLDIAEYLKTYVFSRWIFSSSNSDGQVRFKYSINTQ
ncbi:hypothetical protein [Gracilinema caldarium]|uniref:hypothetical protein n=1 Tax=Gracilinema caldarium TaxID=215591 RepID=UPI0026F1554F|nr:hypothetical protein [Gracilinema caldarium]